MPRIEKPIIVASLLGPTAIGKSRMAVEIAPALEAEIVSVDSMLLYRGMDIGTDKPDRDMLRRVPHHLIDMVECDAVFSVAEYQHMARGVIEDIAGRGKLPLLVGGTGLYFEAVVFDIRFPPGYINDPLRQDIERWAVEDPEGLRDELKRVDPQFSSTQSYKNMRRVIRAMEVYRRTGIPFSSFQAGRGSLRPYYRYVGAALKADRNLHRSAIDHRVDAMIEAGLVEEVRRLKEKGGLSRTARQALGYKEVLEHLDSGLPLEETIFNIKKRSWRYAKRQITWFRRIPGLKWFDLQEDDFYAAYQPAGKFVLEYFLKELQKRGESQGEIL
jgi:tRNA dimethylallyltransferase